MKSTTCVGNIQREENKKKTNCKAGKYKVREPANQVRSQTRATGAKQGHLGQISALKSPKHEELEPDKTLGAYAYWRLCSLELLQTPLELLQTPLEVFQAPLEQLWVPLEHSRKKVGSWIQVVFWPKLGKLRQD